MTGRKEKVVLWCFRYYWAILCTMFFNFLAHGRIWSVYDLETVIKNEIFIPIKCKGREESRDIDSIVKVVDFKQHYIAVQFFSFKLSRSNKDRKKHRSRDLIISTL